MSKKRLKIAVLAGLVLILAVVLSYGQQTQQPAHNPSLFMEKTYNVYLLFNGKWLPDIEPELIGPNNFKTLQNMGYRDEGIKGVQGYSKINTTSLGIQHTGATTFRNGFHFKKDSPQESHVVIQTYNNDGTGSSLFQNETAIPLQGNFPDSGVSLYIENTEAGLGRFSYAPDNSVAYANGKEVLIWSGNEMRVGDFFVTESEVTNIPINPKNYTEAINNKSDTEVAILGGADNYTKLLLHFDGVNGSQTFTDNNSGSTTTHIFTITPNAGVTQATISTTQHKFGSASGKFYKDGTSGCSIYNSLGDGVSSGHVDFDFRDPKTGGATNFTIDAWVWNSAGAKNHFPICGQYKDINNYWGFYVTLDYTSPAVDGELRYVVVTSGVTTIEVKGTWNPTALIWQHVAVSREGNNFYIFADGSKVGETLGEADVPPHYDRKFTIGTIRDVTSDDKSGLTPYAEWDYFDGWIDEFRISKGIARWTANFTPPSVAYHDTQAAYFTIGSTRPLSGMSVYLKDTNATIGTLTGKEWNGASWTSLNNLTDNTNGFQHGDTVEWNSTINTSESRYLNNNVLYYYQFQLSSIEGTISIYHLTLKSPIQPIKDLWDQIYRTPIGFHVKTSAGVSDFTLEVNQDSSDLYPIGAEMGGIGSTDSTVMIFDDRLMGVKFDMLNMNSTAISSGVSIYYGDGDGFKSVSNQFDLTDLSGTPLAQSDVVSWQPVEQGQEFQLATYGKKGYVYKFVWNGTLGTAATPDSVIIDRVYGITAPIQVYAPTFPAFYKNRLMLCGFPDQNQGHRVDFSIKDAPTVFNGFDSSDGVNNSLYFGSGKDLTAAMPIYNRFGSTIDTYLLALNDSETFLLAGDSTDPEDSDYFQIHTIREDVGCPAPLSLAKGYIAVTSELGEVYRNVVFWLSATGPVAFDGAVITTLHGIDNYFNRQHSNFVGESNIKNARGYYDQTNEEYNLIVGSYWFVYDLKRERWYTKSPSGSAGLPQSAFTVTDTNGIPYTYGGFSDGFLRRLDNGTTWDGSAITQIAETGDFYLDNDAWHETLLTGMKLSYKVLTEAVTAGVTLYKDADTAGTSIWSVPLNVGSYGSNRYNTRLNHTSWLYRLAFWAEPSGTTEGFQPLGFGYQYQVEREDQ